MSRDLPESPPDKDGDRVYVDDLEDIFLIFPDAARVSAEAATDAQFDAWARAQVPALDRPQRTWNGVERADFCDALWQAGALHFKRNYGPEKWTRGMTPERLDG